MARYNGHYTFKGLLKYWRMRGKDISEDALRKFLRSQNIRPNADHMYHKSVIDLMDRHMYEIMRDTNSLRGPRIGNDQTQYEAPNSYYHPKGMSNASIELLKNDEVWYESIHRALTNTLMEQNLL